MADEKTQQQKNAEKALEMKKRNDPTPDIPEHRTADEGMQPHEPPQRPVSGALDAEGFEPGLSRAHGVRRSDKG